METIEELTTFLNAATEEGVRGRLLYRGAAWSLMRVNGVLPEDAPPFGSSIDTDLADYGFALLRGAMALRSQQGSSDLTRKAFENAANAFESLVKNGPPEAPDRCFVQTIAALAYHLAGYSAVAYSLFNEQDTVFNATPGETSIRHLVLRDLDQMRLFVRNWLNDPSSTDAYLAEFLQGDAPDLDEALSVILNTTICRALAFFDFALQTGEESQFEASYNLLSTAARLSNNSANVPVWWTCSLCLHLIDDLWQHSLHRILPRTPPTGAEENYSDLRKIFISSLYVRKSAEVELWPSQLEAAQRATNVDDDLVVSLPTSAGKTRVAELAALVALSCGRRVLIVTPLRALSAQTERMFRDTFAPLGFSVSSLYGASGFSAGDEDALRTCQVIVATPEKLDFALRSDSTLIDDVGLIVLDEGHMIGPSEREIRYETLVQRILRRSDASSRRIVCLSAILPSGEQLDDLTAWIRSDDPGHPIRSDWRPTRQRFGALMWGGENAMLRLDLDETGPFLSRFVRSKPPRGKERLPYPRKTSHLTLFAAWEFAAQGKRTLIFSTQANWVEGYGEQVVQLCKRGYLDSLLDDEAPIARGLEVGREWLGENHPAVASLRLGVAIHHGRLPSPFLRELELLLAQGLLKVIVASPTLTQGLNLNAAVLLVPTLYRSGTKITGEEFANIAGRAGRAFVDVEGLVVHVMFDNIDWRLDEWQELVASTKARSLQSGLIQVVAKIIERLTQEGVLDREDAWEYLANAREAWRSPEEDAEDDQEDDVPLGEEVDEEDDEEPLSQLVERLDATVFGLIEALDTDSADLPKALDDALAGSLWARQIAREAEDVAPLHKQILNARAHLIWQATAVETRRGHFAMGVGLEAGLAIDDMADDLAELIDCADAAALSGDIDDLVDGLGGLAERLLFMRPFIPAKDRSLPDDWLDVLRSWLSGVEVSDIGPQNMRAIEEAFTYRLVWALEAIRTRRLSLGWSPETVVGGAAAVVENGVPQLMMAMLIRAGLPSRSAAISAVESAKPVFVSPAEMRAWLSSDEVSEYSEAGDWPTPDTAGLWQRFRAQVLSINVQDWTCEQFERSLDTANPPAEGLYRIETDGKDTWLVSGDFQRVSKFKASAEIPKPGAVECRAKGDTKAIKIIRIGRGSLSWQEDTA